MRKAQARAARHTPGSLQRGPGPQLSGSREPPPPPAPLGPIPRHVCLWECSRRTKSLPITAQRKRGPRSSVWSRDSNLPHEPPEDPPLSPSPTALRGTLASLPCASLCLLVLTLFIILIMSRRGLSYPFEMGETEAQRGHVPRPCSPGWLVGEDLDGSSLPSAPWA